MPGSPGRPFAPQGAQWDQALAHWRTLRTDDEALFDTEHVIDCAGLEPQITWGTDPSQVVGISGRVPDPASDPNRRATLEGALAYMGLTPGTPLAGLPINRVFIGSCTNARLPDLEAAADVVRGRKVAQGVVAMVVPGSSTVKRAAEAKGLDQRVPRRRLLPGANPAARCAPAATATAASRASASSPPPTAISRTARARRRARIWRARRPPRPAPSPAASPTCAA